MNVGDLVKLNPKALDGLGITRWLFKKSHYPNKDELEASYGLIVDEVYDRYSHYFNVQQLSTGILEQFSEDELALI